MRIVTVLALAGVLLGAPAAHAVTNAVPSTFYNTCSPGDQLALKIVVPADGARSLEVRIWGPSLEEFAQGKLYSFADNQTARQAGRDLFSCQQFGCDPAKGQIRIGTYKPGESVDGELIWHHDGEVTSITFLATYAEVPAPCE